MDGAKILVRFKNGTHKELRGFELPDIVQAEKIYGDAFHRAAGRVGFSLALAYVKLLVPPTTTFDEWTRSVQTIDVLPEEIDVAELLREAEEDEAGDSEESESPAPLEFPKKGTRGGRGKG